MISGVTNSDAIPALERMIQFSGARHRLIAHNVANIDTPDFRPLDVSVEEFQMSLGEAIDRGRAGGRTGGGSLEMRDTSTVEFSDGGLTLKPEPAGDNLLFHDGNDRNVETMMQDLVENFFAFRTAAKLMRNRFDLINTAIAGRI